MARKRTSRKACRNCKYIVDYNVEKCPICGSTDFTEDFLGLVIIINAEKSEISKNVGYKEGMWAVKLL